MPLLKRIVKKYFHIFFYFYQYLGYRIIFIILLGILVGIFDGFGLAMFMPLLEMVSNEGESDGSSLGNLTFLVENFKNLGLSYNILSVLLIMVSFFILKGIVKYVLFTYNALLGKIFIRTLRNQLLTSFNRINYKYFVTSNIGQIQNTMTVEVERTFNAFAFYTTTIREALMVTVYMGFAFFIDIKFALLVTIGGALTNFLYKTIYKKTKVASQRFSTDSHLYQGQIIQYVSSFKYLKATAFLNNYANRLRKSIDLIENSRFKIGRLNALLQAAREPILIIVVTCVILIQTQLMGSKLGPILISLMFFYRALSSLLTLQGAYNRFLELIGSLENLISFKRDINKEKESMGKRQIKKLNNSIQLKKATLAYSDVQVLVNIDLEVKKNETIAFVGESGSGKTTLINVIAGLIPLDKGNLYIDGINRNDINIFSYQERIGYITQDPVIFNDTIFNNITLWAEPNELNLKRFREVLEKAALSRFVNEQYEGKETILGHDGINLSGGQRQRISIARELFKEIDLLIMDEATSALDSETEKNIQSSLDNLKGNYTILLVAHRFSTIRNADRIVLMNKGKIDQIGTFKELLTTSTIFKKLVSLQEL